MSNDEIKSSPQKSKYTITADEAIRYAKEALKNEEFVALIRDHMANPTQTDEESEIQQAQISRIAREYALSRGMPYPYQAAYKIALGFAESVLIGRRKSLDSEEVRERLSNSFFIEE
ncbi:hypothetical protein [Methyloligella solikamskensis]|uniref:Uncharacterized protein n=1 Tax=Methyloligella solikamskensis TaxID=1177756 RepID=A0ABW3JC27_9HYPH